MPWGRVGGGGKKDGPVCPSGSNRSLLVYFLRQSTFSVIRGLKGK